MRYENTGNPLGKIDRIEKKNDFPGFNIKLFMPKVITSVTDRKLLKKLLEEKDFGVPIVVEQTQQFAYDRKNIKNTIREALISNRKKLSSRTFTCRVTNTFKNRARPNKNEKTILQILHFTKIEPLQQMPSPSVDVS